MKNKSLNESFYLIMGGLICTFLVLLFCNPLGDQLNVFFAKTDDLFADFFNVLIYISDNDVYFNTFNGPEQKNYFPIAYVIMDAFSGFFNYSGKILSDVYSSRTAIISCVLFSLMSILLFFHSLGKIVKLNSKVIFIISFSSIFLFTIERGNLILLSAAMAFYFLAYKDSKDKKNRLFALTALCMSVVLKGYPVVFGLFLLQEKRYKDILFCIIVTAILVIFPFFYFKHGLENIPQFISNVQLNNMVYDDGIYPRYGLVIFNHFLFSVLHAYDSIYASIGYYIAKYSVVLLSLLSIWFFFKEKMIWKKLLMISIIIAYLPSNNGFYCGIYFFPSLLLFLNDNSHERKDYLYMLLFCLILNPLQIVIHNQAISWMLSNIAVLIIWLMLIIDNICCVKKNA